MRKNIIAYADLAIGPISAVQGKSPYTHFEAGLKWSLADSWPLTGSYRATQDALSTNGSDGKPLKYSMTLLTAGIAYVME